MPADLQAKLLRVLQERELHRLGSSEAVKIDVRVLAATNIDLTERIRQGKFRDDLYYRLNVVPFQVPPLRERPSDIPILVRHFLEKVCRQEEIPIKSICDGVLSALTRESWPGNVRELENRVEMAVALSGDREMLSAEDFGLFGPPEPALRIAPEVPDRGLDFDRTVGDIERSILEQALKKARGNKTQAAEMLGLKRTTLTAKLRSLDLAANCC
jgi:DNA-binding NtrC family response regulator